MKSLMLDARVAVRGLVKRPGFSIVAILILAIGIGANSAVFSVMYGLLLRPLPFPGSERMVQVWNTYPLINLPQAAVSIPDYLDRREHVDAFEESTLYFFTSFNISVEGSPQRVNGIRTTASMFPLLAAETALGRVFTEEEDKPGSENVVVISDGLWRNALGGDPSIVGQELRLDGVPHQIVGVMGPAFIFPTPTVSVWKPFAITAQQASDASRGNEFSQMVARLRPATSLEEAQDQLDALLAANMERLPGRRTFWENSGFGTSMVPLRTQYFGSLQPVLLLLQAMVAFVMLIVCANIANLLLTRMSGRRREFGIRVSLGAGRWQIARQLMVESLVLALVGGGLGVIVALQGVELLNGFGLQQAARGVYVGLDFTVLLFALGVTLATGFAFGLFPVLSLWRNDPAAALGEDSRGTSGGRSSAFQRRALVVVEMALAIILLAGAGLMGRSFVRLLNEEPGFRPEGLMVARVSLPASRYGTPAEQVQFFDRALQELAEAPGVGGATLVSSAPFSGNSSSGSYGIQGYTPGPGEGAPHGLFRVVDPGFFETLEIPLMQGRLFAATDVASSEPVAIVDRLLVEKYFKDKDPIGQYLVGGQTPIRIVGVVNPIKIGTLGAPVTKETIYLPYRQRASGNMTFVLKGGSDPTALSNPLREAIARIDPEQPLFGITTMSQQLNRSLSNQQISLVMLAIFAVVAVLLAAIGIYGVLAFSVSQRTRELGTRMALGARRADIVRMILRQGLVVALIGVALGVATSLALGSLISSMLFQVSPRDPLTLAVVSGLLILVAGAASYIPALRASRVELLEALRYD